MSYNTLNTHDELKKHHGKWVTCSIKGDEIQNAKISVEGERVFICQNLHSGLKAKDKLGFEYSWIISTKHIGDKYEDRDRGCTDITLVEGAPLPRREEVPQPFEPDKTIKELGIDPTRKFIVVRNAGGFNKGDILNLREDDDSYNPFFVRVSDHYEYPCHFDKLAYYEEPFKTPITDPTTTELLTPRKSFMTKAIHTLKSLALSKTDRVLRENGLEDENGKMTSSAYNYMLEQLTEERWKEQREKIATTLSKEEGKK